MRILHSQLHFFQIYCSRYDMSESSPSCFLGHNSCGDLGLEISCECRPQVMQMVPITMPMRPAANPRVQIWFTPNGFYQLWHMGWESQVLRKKKQIGLQDTVCLWGDWCVHLEVYKTPRLWETSEVDHYKILQLWEMKLWQWGLKVIRQGNVDLGYNWRIYTPWWDFNIPQCLRSDSSRPQCSTLQS